MILALALAKFGWKLADRKTGFGPEVKPYERAGATAMHWVLNALIVLVPVSGYLISTSEGAPIDIFGLFDVPALLRNIGLRPATWPSTSTTTWLTAVSPWLAFTQGRRSSTISWTRVRPLRAC